MAQYVQYGCGLSAPTEWINFDASPTLRLQKMPLVGDIFRKKVDFPSNVRYGDILKGLPGIETNSCDGVYCSHVLEHLSLSDLRKALRNTYAILKPGGIFRCVLPDLASAISGYIHRKENGDKNASIWFMKETLLGLEERPKGLKQLMVSSFGNSHHLWMWDAESLTEELRQAGFIDIRKCSFNDSADGHFREVEDEGRFYSAIALEAKKQG